jgi:hypothetical protein
MAELVIQIEDRLLLRLKRRAWKQGLPLRESLRVLLAVTAEEDESDASGGRGGFRQIARVACASQAIVSASPASSGVSAARTPA